MPTPETPLPRGRGASYRHRRGGRRAILAQVAAELAPGGVLVQYTYGPVPPVPRTLAAELGPAGTRAACVLANVPRAAVWRYRQRDAQRSLSRAA